MGTQKAIFEQDTNETDCGHSHHWVTHNNRKYLSLRTEKNVIKMFDASGQAFAEDDKLRIRMAQDDEIHHYEFDRTFENIFILKNAKVLEKRAISDLNHPSMSVRLEQALDTGTDKKLLTLSDGGSACAVGGGFQRAYFYFVDLMSQTQRKFKPVSLRSAFAPCFINGDADSLAIGGAKDQGVE